MIQFIVVFTDLYQVISDGYEYILNIHVYLCEIIMLLN